MTAVSKVSLLVNPAAGGGRAGSVLERIIVHLHDLGVDPEVLTPTSFEGSLEAIQQIGSTSTDRLLLVGGDGLIHLAAGALAGGSTVLGVIAAGTGNDTARALGLLDKSLEQRVDRAMGDPIAIDLAMGSDQPVVTSAVCGFPVTVNERANGFKFPTGPNKYTFATLLELPRMTPLDYQITLDGESFEATAAAVVVANTAYFGGGMRICPDADPTDGLLDVCVIGNVGRLDLLRSLQQVRTGRHVDHPKVTMFKARAVSINGVGSARADGEPLTGLPITLRAVQRALLVAGAKTGAPGRK